MQKTEFPEVKERMETKVCCAYNATRGCQVSSRVGIVDLCLQPLRALKMLMDGLATDGTSSLWLQSLLGPPLMMHLFPFDFLYLDEDLRIMEGVELFPTAPFPKFETGVVSALILPLRTLASSGTQKGDQLIICAHEELENRIAAIATPHLIAPVSASATPEPVERIQTPSLADALPVLAPACAPGPTFDQRIPLQTSTVSPTAGFTVSLATTWQITRTTTASTVLADSGEETARPAPATILENPASETETAVPPPDAVMEAPPEIPAVSPDTTIELLPAAAETEKCVSAPAGRTENLLLKEPDPIPLSELNGNQLLEAVAAAQAAETDSRTMIPLASEETTTDDRIARSREAWEKTQVKASHPPAASAIKTKKKLGEQKKDPLGTRVIRWLNLEDPLPERRKIIRLRLEGLQAWDVNGDQTKKYPVRDICPTGFCLRAQTRWRKGQLVSLVIERGVPTELDHEHRVRVQARVVRCEADGVGLEFVFPKGTEFQPWQRVKTKRSDETEAAFIVRELRFSIALGLLRRLCPGAAEEVRHAFHDRLSNKRVASAVDIVLLAEEMLARDGQVDLARAHTDMIMRIIEGGSWVEDSWIRKLWAGLLVSSCSADGQDTSNQPFIDLLAKLTPLHLRILSFVCGKATEALAAGVSAKDFYLDCTSEELMAASDSHSFARIQQTIGHLASYGLLAETARPSYVALSDKSKTRMGTTALGLKMWARCSGQRA